MRCPGARPRSDRPCRSAAVPRSCRPSGPRPAPAWPGRHRSPRGPAHARPERETTISHPLRNIATVVAAVTLVAALAGWWRTAPDARTQPRAAATELVDPSALYTARRLAAFAGTPAEQTLAARAVETADHVLDLELASALRDATERPPPDTPAIRTARARLEAAAQELVADNARIAALREAAAASSGAQREALDAELAIRQADYEVHQYRFAEANRLLSEAGGNLRETIETLVGRHRSAAAGREAKPAAEVELPAGLVHQARRWLALRRKDRALAAARSQVEASVQALAGTRRTLSAEIADANDAAASTDAERLANARARSARGERLASLDERVGAQQTLARVYDDWRAIAATQSRAAANRALLSSALIAGIALVLLSVGRAIERGLARFALDRRHSEALRTVLMVALQVVAALLIVFVLIGPPTQLATVLGLATAGLTVALKDFIVAFAGWFTLMGRNGIRLGDWVEIRGVAGEVVELGLFRTVLLETGNWTDTGQPTGRRVTFTNSYAIEGHYFNFSTSGQWLWDTLQVVVPNGADLYAFVAALTEKSKALTAASAQEAEAEWQRAARNRTLTGLSAAPAIGVKPVVGGTEISLRYITRASDRYRLRSELNAAAVELLRDALAGR